MINCLTCLFWDDTSLGFSPFAFNPEDVFSFLLWWRIHPINGSQALTLTAFAWTLSMPWIMRRLADGGGAMTVCQSVSHSLGVGRFLHSAGGCSSQRWEGDGLCCLCACCVICLCQRKAALVWLPDSWWWLLVSCFHFSLFYTSFSINSFTAHM